jgi:hypothetical protein
MARLLESTRPTAEQRAYGAAIRDSGEHLLTLVNDVLDFAKLGAGKIELHAGEVEVEDLMRGVAELLSPRAKEKGLEIAWGAPGGAGVIRADEGRLRQILLNFAGNAVKFTETGGVLLGLTQPERGRLRFTVEDTGPGVAEGLRQRIFEAFAQADPAHEHLGSTRLGGDRAALALAMNGEVGVDARPGGGATFWFEAAFRDLGRPAGPAALAGRKVGIASANPIVREAALRQITACGGDGIGADDIDDLAQRTRFGDVVLVDHGVLKTYLYDRPPGGAIVLLAPGAPDRPLSPRNFVGYLIAAAPPRWPNGC